MFLRNRKIGSITIVPPNPHPEIKADNTLKKESLVILWTKKKIPEENTMYWNKGADQNTDNPLTFSRLQITAKIISKLLLNRLGEMMPDVRSETVDR